MEDLPTEDDIERHRLRLLEARRAAVGDPDAKLAWVTWSTAARIQQLQKSGLSWPEIQAQLGAAKVGKDEALWREITDRNPEYAAAARAILEDDDDVRAAAEARRDPVRVSHEKLVAELALDEREDEA